MPSNILIVVDMQNDFLQNGSLPVPNAVSIIPVVNRLLTAKFDAKVATKDWHPINHSSFAIVHKAEPFTKKDDKMLWPVHCVADTWGSDLGPFILVNQLNAVFHKGGDADAESYSALKDENGKVNTLTLFLLGHKLLLRLAADDEVNVYVCGLATDYCVRATAEDCAELDINTYVVTDACASVDPNYTFTSDKVKTITSEEVIKVING